MERPALESLAAFLDRISDPRFKAGEWISPKSDSDEAVVMPYVELSDVARGFIEAAYGNRWLDTKFDWPEWAASAEAARLRDDASAIATSGPQELSRLLTVCVRQDRFMEGALLAAFDCGLILRIVQRAAALLETGTDAPPSPGLVEGGLSVPNSHGKTPLRKLSSLQAGGLGELLALAKLNSLGVAAYMSPEGAPGHDIIAIVDEKPRSIEVKTRQFLQKATEITRWPINFGTKRDAEFFLLIELDLRTISPTFYLLTNEQARSTNRSFGNGQGNCYPAQVRLLVKANDFSSMVAANAN